MYEEGFVPMQAGNHTQDSKLLSSHLVVTSNQSEYVSIQ